MELIYCYLSSQPDGKKSKKKSHAKIFSLRLSRLVSVSNIIADTTVFYLKLIFGQVLKRKD